MLQLLLKCIAISLSVYQGLNHWSELQYVKLIKKRGQTSQQVTQSVRQEKTGECTEMGLHMQSSATVHCHGITEWVGLERTLKVL